ncbi:Tetratricopeptide repeat protein [Planctomycetes bacterium Poly30]|uniref:Tetratricopeptide repeat protein n=1 Tax=Saltatorellus ferox TaxID=2528018 RepID=A0A518EVJ7_9BACT|nr:Tetratricopeptide repeat protein [Planctomycetes bacterium Poly30]
MIKSHPARPLGPIGSGLPSAAPTLALWLPLVLLVSACGSDDSEAAKPGPTNTATGSETDSGARVAPDVDPILRRERVAVLFSKEQSAEALAELQPLLDLDAPAARDLVSAAQIGLRTGDWDQAAAHVKRAIELYPDDPGALYTSARLAALDGDFETSRAAFERVLELRPEDPASKVGLADALYQLEESDADIERARQLLEEVAGLGREIGLQWFVSAVYKRGGIARDFDEGEEVIRNWQDLYQSLNDQGFEATNESTLDQGTLAVVAPPAPVGTFPGSNPIPFELLPPRTVLTLPEGTTRFEIDDLDGDRTPDVITVADGAVAVHVRERKGEDVMTTTVLGTGATGPIRLMDLNQRRTGDTLDLVIATGESLQIFEQRDLVLAGEPAWVPSPVDIPGLGGTITDFETVDFDHDGELDLFVTGTFGARILRNDGVGARVNSEGELQPRGVWTDASEPATLPGAAQLWCIVEDFDGDNDVDLFCAGPDGVHLMDSQRRGFFKDRGADAFGGAKFTRKPVVEDFDGNGYPDVFVPDAENSTLWFQTAPWEFQATPIGAAVPEGSDPVASDLDFDGAVDLFWPVPGTSGAGLLSAGLQTRTPVAFGALEGATGPMLVRDIDTPDPYGSLALEVLQLRGGELIAQSPDPKSLEPTGLGNAIYLKFIGKKDNRQGVGAVVEVRAGNVYRRIYLRGRAEVVGIGQQKWADVIRVTWPNGVIQQNLDVEEGVAIMLDDPAFGEQPEGLIGSCPFLYTWNGETFEFISDVIGMTPLGLPMAPGMLVPPDHDEYVLVRGDQLKVDANGELVMQFTEELREVTYLDRVRLDVIDHPEDSAIYPNERFTFPPFPEPHVHTVSRVAKPRKVTGSDGRDWTAELQENDMHHPAPFERLAGQFLGLAEPHWLELEFDPAEIADAKLIRLVATGWFFWSDASVNVAAAGTPGVDFVPPILEVQNEAGDWVPAGPPLGFPAGKTKTMVIDVTAMIPREAARFRIGSTLELYWDCIELAVCDDDAEFQTSSLEPKSTELWSRGFSDPIVPERQDMPLFFDWDRTTQQPRWNQHPGFYTRYGAVDELLEEVDDRYVIMGSGDALTIRFDATALPAVPEGYTRDYLVFLDGWAKDRDPNTYEALEVEPLPFHAMSGYPYRADESFPDSPEMQAWRKEWNTRPDHRWIVPLSTERETEWVREAIAKSPRR